ncbi:hypothetical protein Lste_2594 [Legionella steelei]|uniref:Uncharacterized protein n=1 Tax=Legionella steelei TaxID=947033 RepID=A0A0W0ZJ51_9GAMM|nr:hypothetical protein [Legionella steelei]KTD69436.1 hypothetical protein Lste_2594 [Legionella steelei]
MSLSEKFKQFVDAGEFAHLRQFQALEDDVKIAIYQKLLFQAGEDRERNAKAAARQAVIEQHPVIQDKSNAEKALDTINEDFDNLSPEVRQEILIERQRYNVAKANAIYQEYLQQKVLEKVVTARKRDTREPILQDNLLFDPQGRLVYELTLSEEEQDEVLKKMEEAVGRPNVAVRRVGIDLKDALKDTLGGRTPTDTTLCSIDLSGEGSDVHMKLRDSFLAKYGPQPLPSHQRASQVASFEETYAHMCLMAGTCERRSITFGTDKRTISKDAWQDIRHKAAQKLQTEVAKVYKEAVKNATDRKTGVVDVEKLNKSLAKARTELAAAAKKAVIEEVVAYLKEQKVDPLKEQKLGRDEILKYMQQLSSSLDKHKFTAHTATGYDYFYTSNYLQQGMLISGTQQTAHEKPEFLPGKRAEDQAAYRRVAYTYRDKNGELQPTSAMSARIPSPALIFHEVVGKDGQLRSMTDKEIRGDLVKKYGFLHDQMRAMRGGKDGPVVEHLFTSFHSGAFDSVPLIGDRNNRQRASALYMMQAMHEFNARYYDRVKELQAQFDAYTKDGPMMMDDGEWQREYNRLHDELEAAKEQLQQQEPTNNFLYVQNIGTNRHTRDLGYQVDRSFLDVTGSVELDDITLSTEMAMLHALQENSVLSPEIKQQVADINKAVLQAYNAFLTKDPKDREKYFAASDEGLALIYDIRNFKKQLAKDLSQKNEETEDLPTLASNALARMIATNQHWDSRYGQLAQTLSMYIEYASTGGCKSGNERNQDVMLRFALLKSIDERVQHGGRAKLKAHEEAIYSQLTQYANGNSADPDKLREAIAVGVSKCNLHGGAAAISREDQGGAAKVASFSWIQDIKSDFLRSATQFFLGVVAIATLPFLAIPPWRKFVLSAFDTNNAADREMHLDATGASKTQAHKGQEKKTREAILDVLNEDPLFMKKDGKPITGKEKDLFEKGAMEKLAQKELKKAQKAQGKLKGEEVHVREEVRRDEPQHPGEDFGVGSPGVLRDGLRFTHAGSVEEPKKKPVVSTMGNLDSGVGVGVSSDPTSTSTDPSVVRRVI